MKKLIQSISMQFAWRARTLWFDIVTFLTITVVIAVTILLNLFQRTITGSAVWDTAIIVYGLVVITLLFLFLCSAYGNLKRTWWKYQYDGSARLPVDTLSTVLLFTNITLIQSLLWVLLTFKCSVHWLMALCIALTSGAVTFVLTIIISTIGRSVGEQYQISYENDRLVIQKI